jgi:replication factor C small subunit
VEVVLTSADIEQARARRQAGESLKALAAELGLSWQKLEKGLRRGLPDERVPATLGEVRRLSAGGRLTERYRPTSLDEMVGQEAALKILETFVASPYPVAFLLEGETGTGKTTAALALARALGVEFTPPLMGGLWIVASGDQTADAVREVRDWLWHVPMVGSGWKVAVVNEADRMSQAAETVWLDVLEALPRRSVVAFTTNHEHRLSQRFRDRCLTVTFESAAGRVRSHVERLVRDVWRRETGAEIPESVAKSVAQAATVDGQVSFRRALNVVETMLATHQA